MQLICKEELDVAEWVFIPLVVFSRSLLLLRWAAAKDTSATLLLPSISCILTYSSSELYVYNTSHALSGEKGAVYEVMVQVDGDGK